MGLLAMKAIGPLRFAKSRPGFIAHPCLERHSSESWSPIAWNLGVGLWAKARKGLSGRRPVPGIGCFRHRVDEFGDRASRPGEPVQLALASAQTLY